MRLVEEEGVADSDLLTLERPESRRSKKGRFWRVSQIAQIVISK
jgi:hypothetical protein